MRETLVFSIAASACLALTPAVIWIARRAGMVARPTRDRWHSRPTALLGGVAIFLGFMAGVLPFLQVPDRAVQTRILGVLVGGSLMFLLGLVDDLVHIKPTSKLIGQILAACILVYANVYFNILGIPLITIPLTIFFVVGITNAFNLLDNMDGLAAGVAAVAALALFFFNQILGRPESTGILALGLAGSLAGFLVFNFNPAKIFMGDAGSMFLGFMLASIAILGTWEQASNVFLILAVPVLLLGLPIFDTTFVTITRTLAGRPISQGGRDHTSHRLVALGLSERRAVLLMYAVCAAFSVIAVLSLKLGVFAAGVLSILCLIVVFLFGVFLGHEKIYQPVSTAETKAIAAPGREDQPSRGRTILGSMVRHKMRLAEVGIDFLLFGAAYVGAYLIRFEGSLDSRAQELIAYSLPVVIAVKFVTFYGFGLYRRIWEFMGINDLIAIAKAVLTGSLISVLAMWGLTRLSGYSRAVFLLDGILLLIFASGSRILFRVFRETLALQAAHGRRLLIYGAGAAGELLVRELRNDPGLGYVPVGFLDDDDRKQGRRIHGLRIHGGREDLVEVVRGGGVDEIVIAIPSLHPAELEALENLCHRVGVPCRIMRRVSSTFLG